MAARETHCQQPAESRRYLYQAGSGRCINRCHHQKSCAQKEKLRYPCRYYRQTDGETLYGAPVRSKLSLATSAQETFTCDIKGLKPKLWEPATPNLYDFRVSLTEGKNKVTDCITVTSGFRTFESKDGFLYLNGRKYWLRGGNHIPFALCPNDSLLADKFMKLMKEGNVQSTRTHTTPGTNFGCRQQTATVSLSALRALGRGS